jgi:hypothetical protein
MLTQVTIQVETIKQSNERPKGGRPRKNEPRQKRYRPFGCGISPEAYEAIRLAAERLGVSQGAIIEALGRSLGEGQIAA